MRQELLHDGEMQRALYDHELAEVVAELKHSLAHDYDDHLFTVTENRRHVTMVLIEKTGNIHINEQAGEKLKACWPASATSSVMKVRKRSEAADPSFIRRIARGEHMCNCPVSARLALIAGCLFVIAGCSATNYSKPIATFASATANANSALADLNKTVTAEYTALLSKRALKNQSLAVMGKEGECVLDSKRCRIILVAPADRRKDQLFPPEPPYSNLLALMGDVNTYAQNLAALVADDSAEKAKADVNAALGSVQTLANTVAKADGKGNEKETIPSFATPVGSAVNWLIGQYANYVKLEGLKAATKEARPVIERAATILKQAAIVGSDLQRVQLTDSFRDKIAAYQDNRNSETSLNAAVDAAKLYDGFLRSPVGETFEQMGKAHSALADALQDSNLSWPQVNAQVQSFAAQAEELAKIVQNLAALGTKNKGENK